MSRGDRDQSRGARRRPLIDRLGRSIPFLGRRRAARNAAAPSFQRELTRTLSRDLQSDDRSSTRTELLMERLGYAQSPAAERHRRLTRWAGRAGLWIAVLGVIGLGIRLHNALPDRMTPADVTVPTAVRGELQQQQERFDAFFRAIGTIRLPDPAETVEPIDRITPLRDPFGAPAAPGAEVAPDAEDGEGAAAAPFRIA